MKRAFFLVSILHALVLASSIRAAAESQIWKLRAGDNIDVIAATLEIPTEEIRKHNPGIVETNLKIGQKLKLPLRSHGESRMLEQELGKKAERIGHLERQNSELDSQIANAASQLRWQPVWLWGFWILFGILAFIAAGACWLFRQTHPKVFEEPHPERTIADLRNSQIRVRSFPYDEQGARSDARQWHPPLSRLPHAR